ncbi:MAG: SMP-30/gluconolactonase/LRE family protein [Chloroflexi bacterium]|nr:SMP-30/gluconolactonase/LRE family protein [Chloroflexota bacterium]
MTQPDVSSFSRLVSRRRIIKAAAALGGVAALGPRAAWARMPMDAPVELAQAAATTPNPPSVISNPPRQWGPDAPPEIYPDPDILTVDPSFGKYLLGITAIHRLWTGGKWLEGPIWSSEGNYLIFSDVQANITYRLIWETMEVTKFHDPSMFGNGNTVDFQGRLVTCQDFFRRLVRYENDGTLTVLADSYQGKPLNSPNGVVPHPDGSYWFTDPPYGDQLSEGQPDEAGGPANPNGNLNPRTGDTIGSPTYKRQLPSQTYRVDSNGTLTVVVPEDVLKDPNGLDFSPDYKTFYLLSTGPGPGDTGGGGDGNCYAFDVSSDGKSVSNKRLFTDFMVDGVHCGPDDMTVDVDGNLYFSSNAPLGYSGVTVYNPAGKLIGRIRLPEACANLQFGGPKHNFLLMTASQSIYALQLNTQGAHPGN